MLMFKKGVPIYGLRSEILWALDVAERIWPGDCTVTSSRFGDNHGWGSIHFSGNAVDLRTRNLTDVQIKDVAAELAAILEDDYDVVIESLHIHIEYQPKTLQEYPESRPFK